MKYLYLPEITTHTIWTVVGNPLSILLLWLAAANILAILLMRSDKQRARTRGVRRIPEKYIFLIALLGGSAGAMLGMLIFRHKTEKWYFALGMPIILILQIALPILIAVLLR